MKGRITMFCKNCGKEYSEGSLFCIYCGGKIESESIPEKIEPATTSEKIEPETAAEKISAETASADEPTISSEPAAASVSYAVPRPEQRPSAGADSGYIAIQTPPAEKPEKYYTFGHLALCLGAVAVMAIVAGVFAGLYFSVIA